MLTTPIIEIVCDNCLDEKSIYLRTWMVDIEEALARTDWIFENDYYFCSKECMEKFYGDKN